jgi:hypothetical protein
MLVFCRLHAALSVLSLSAHVPRALAGFAYHHHAPDVSHLTTQMSDDLAQWTTARLGAFFPPQTTTTESDTTAEDKHAAVPADASGDDGDWFTDAFNAAFAPSAQLTLATAPPAPNGGPDQPTDTLAALQPGEGEDVQTVSGADALKALRDLATGGPSAAFSDVRVVSGDDQVRGARVLCMRD